MGVRETSHEISDAFTRPVLMTWRSTRLPLSLLQQLRVDASFFWRKGAETLRFCMFYCIDLSRDNVAYGHPFLCVCPRGVGGVRWRPTSCFFSRISSDTLLATAFPDFLSPSRDRKKHQKEYLYVQSHCLSFPFFLNRFFVWCPPHTRREFTRGGGAHTSTLLVSISVCV